MNLGEFRNRIKQLKAYKAEVERRLRRTPMRSGRQPFGLEAIKPFGNDLLKMSEEEFWKIHDRLWNEGKRDLAANLKEYYDKITNW